MNNIFHVDLQLEIVSYVPLLDRLEYARCNRCLCQELMTRLRIVTLRKERIEYLSSESFRKKILGLIVDPYEQFELHSNYPNNYHIEIFTNRPDNRIELPENSFIVPNLVLRTLFIHIEDFPLIFPYITRVQHLLMKWEPLLRKGTISQVSSLGSLRNLTLFSYPDSFLSLGASRSDGVQLQNLRYLKLVDCQFLSDVSGLGHIFELHLIDCYALIDISCLNHNKIIVIEECPVLDYSQSFRFSRDITVSVAEPIYYGNFPTVKGINLDNLEAVQSLYIDYNRMTNITDPLAYRESLPSSLRHLRMERVRSRVLIPPYHNLNELSISECNDVSLQNLENIKVIRIDSCHEIIDWSPLQENTNIEISCCNGFNSGKQLSNVKNLTFITYNLNHMTDLTNITHLELFKPERSHFPSEPQPYIWPDAREMNLFSSANNLQEIELEIEVGEDFKSSDVSLLYSIMESPQLKRVVLTLFSDQKINFETFHQLIVRDFDRFYEVEIKPQKKLVLFERRKVEALSQKKKKDEGSLFF